MSGVLVVCESKEGKLRKPSREILSLGRKLAAESGGTLSAVSFGTGAADLASDTGSGGATKLFVVNDPSLDDYMTETHTSALQAVVAMAQPDILLFSASTNGRDLAPRMAARLNVGVASDVTSLEWSDGKLRGTRPLYSGKVIAHFEAAGKPAVATVRPNAVPAEDAGGAPSEVVPVEWQAGEPKTKLIETKAPAAGELTIAEADIIVSGGRGLKDAENYSYIRDLALALGGAVGASRATVDAGWIDHQHQVGQTGRVVSPNLYIAVGISGAIQHLAGMSTSKHIIAINKDPEAPIFRVSDLAVVGDLFEILPVLTEEVKKAKAQH
ncbi:MAG: electron transfer flavoprotein subunit alpha/FixB family protein [Acidobacteriota bacterium]